MNKSVILFFSSCFLIFYLLANKPLEDPDYQTPYREALKIFSLDNSSDKQDSVAIIKFGKAIAILEKNPVNDTVLLDCYQKIGALYIGFDDQGKANINFNKIIQFAQKKQIPGQTLFHAYMYSGRTFYSLSIFDSAYRHYKTAEKILEKLPLSGTDLQIERLYNMLGVLFYDNGNYKEAGNYFKKAIQELDKIEAKKSNYQDLYNNYRLNIVSCLIKLKLFQEADVECNAIETGPKYNPLINNALHYKKAEIHIGLKNYQAALFFIRKVNFTDRNILKTYNTIAQVFMNLSEFDSANLYIQKAILRNSEFYPNAKNYDLAISYKLWGNILAAKKDYKASLEKYQNAIGKLIINFDADSIYRNPKNFNGSFSASSLLDCFMAKADIFYEWFGLTGDIRDLKASLQTYETVFSLARYMENTYNSDEAVLFLNERKLSVHDAAIRISLQLYDLTKDPHYFESAISIDEQNKSVVLNRAVGEKQLLLTNKVPQDLLEKEKAIKRNITILSLKENDPQDIMVQKETQKKITNYEIELGKIREKIKVYETNTELGALETKLVIIQKKLTNSNCILSYHTVDTGIIGFLITKNNFIYKKIRTDSLFFNDLRYFTRFLQDPVQETNLSIINKKLYDNLIAPFSVYLRNLDAITFIPDDDLHLLPFEVLQNENGALLTAQFAISYYTNYSNAFLSNSFNLAHEKVLAFAPFSGRENNGFGQLAASVSEVQDLHGKIVLDSFATKTSFLNQLGLYRILHLATHAKVNDSFPDLSHIVFYNKHTISDTGLLYSMEIANLDLTATKLVYLSACETGAGKLIRGEGLMSLSRAFSYAGCPGIITSLWKADDESTAYITNRFYYYLDKKYESAKALQLSKRDYLLADTIAKNKKTPYYWAHLIYIGKIKSEKTSWLQEWHKWVFILLLLIPLFIFFKKKRFI